MSPRIRLRSAAALLGLSLLMAVGTAHAQQTQAQAPTVYSIQTKQTVINGTIAKREKTTVWVRQTTSDGRPGPQIGLPLEDIVAIRIPRPGVFAAAEKLLTTVPQPDAKIFANVQSGLDAVIRQFKSIRDLPGVPVDEAVLLKGRLYQARSLWREALRQYEDILMQNPLPDNATAAQVLAGIAYEKLEEPLFAIEYLAGIPLPEDDEPLLSMLLYSLGNAYVALENYDNALLSYLPLVVFYPYVGDNEARGLAAVLPCYAALQEWEPLYRTIQTIKTTYPDSEASKAADEIIAQYGKELAKAGLFIDGDRVVADSDATAVEGTTVDYSAP